VKVEIKSSPLRFRQKLNTKRKISSLQTPSRTVQPHCNRQCLEFSDKTCTQVRQVRLSFMELSYKAAIKIWNRIP